MSGNPSDRRPYVLGTCDDELARLGLQHRLWSDASVAAWKRAGIGIGARVLDVGCGPGFAAFDLAQLVTPAGSVVGIDESASFIAYLNDQARARGLTQLRGEVDDAQAMKVIGAFDAAYIRWVLCFTSDPGAVLTGVAKNLKHGGRVVIDAYFNYTSMTTAPRRASHDVLVQATAKSWKARGGDPDVMARVPALARQAGLEVVDLVVHQRIARGGVRDGQFVDPMLAWPVVWWRTYAPKLVEMGLVSRAQCDEALAELDALSADETQFYVCPTVFEIIARKV